MGVLQSLCMRALIFSNFFQSSFFGILFPLLDEILSLPLPHLRQLMGCRFEAWPRLGYYVLLGCGLRQGSELKASIDWQHLLSPHCLCLFLSLSSVMEAFCQKLGKNLRLFELEGSRLLLSKQPKFEALVSSAKSMLNPVKGLDMRSLTEGRFLIRFNHIIDWSRALEGCPWSFKKNMLILNSATFVYHHGEELVDPGEDTQYGLWLRAPARTWGPNWLGGKPDPSTLNYGFSLT
ncbi:hypothetical protein Salat_1666700 [Sesamum alatum]|uniref:DUF4283 domain-containing protein n=1 Tax=Sesamum alatum TaxID=300844 RepID=A0AAE2CJR7_9LAMI|nr:hypothetical protein Salat_1666700 [Sesamum alatum]